MKSAKLAVRRLAALNFELNICIIIFSGNVHRYASSAIWVHVVDACAFFCPCCGASFFVSPSFGRCRAPFPSLYIGGSGVVQPGNSFGSCASVIPRLGYFQRFVLRRPGRALPPSQCKKKSNKKKFTSRVGYQCKMNGNVSCTLLDG